MFVKLSDSTRISLDHVTRYDIDTAGVQLGVWLTDGFFFTMDKTTNAAQLKEFADYFNYDTELAAFVATNWT